MRAIRRHLGVLTFVWLACQVASLSAFVPRDCCAAHAHKPKAASKECHDQTTTDPQHAGHGQDATAALTPHASGQLCPMSDGDGAACPMHRQAPTDPTCTMRTACKGPGAALATLLATLAVPSEFVSVTPDILEQPATRSGAQPPLAGTAHPDTPPPRA